MLQKGTKNPTERNTFLIGFLFALLDKPPILLIKVMHTIVFEVILSAAFKYMHVFKTGMTSRVQVGTRYTS